jgi:exosome complex RNA-binding protein Csl4
MRVLAPGDRVEQLVERVLIEQADQERVQELADAARVGGVVAGQVVALSLGADPSTVLTVARALIGGEPDAD